MGKVYKNKKGSSCSLCKPHKNGLAPKKKNKVRAKESNMDKEIKEVKVKEYCEWCGGDLPKEIFGMEEPCCSEECALALSDEKEAQKELKRGED
jgi:predicted nucleic acid-binding Zn ribbon protein